VTAPTTPKRAPKRAKKPVAAAVAVPAASPEPPSAPVAAMAPVAPTVPTLPSTLTLRQVGEVAALLMPVVASGRYAVDASAVLQCDTAGVQLLIAASKSAAARGGALVLTGASPALVDGAIRLGVAAMLGLERAA